MRLRARQHRFLATVLGGWIAVRAVLLWSAMPGASPLPAPLPEPWLAWPAPAPPRLARNMDAPILLPAGLFPRPTAGALAEPSGSEAPLALTATARDRMTWLAMGGERRFSPYLLLAGARYERPPPDAAPAPPPGPVGAVAAAAPLPTAPGRLHAEAYLFVRQGSGGPSAAPAGTLGGSQAAARLTWRLGSADGPERFALAARVYAPLAQRGAEGAVGLDWHPLPGQPLRLSVERRQRLDARGRSAWSAYAAGGFYREPRPGLVVDGYAQAGVVGLERRDAFVDGSLRAGAKVGSGAVRPLLGAGLWGAAQPGAARLDAGPRVALALPVLGGTLAVALEGRFRLAGRAAPGSGAVLTVAAGF